MVDEDLDGEASGRVVYGQGLRVDGDVRGRLLKGRVLHCLVFESRR
jgi:hypothetical protein